MEPAVGEVDRDRDRLAMEALKAPVPGDQIRQRPIHGGGQAPYVTDEFVMQRLDEVLGADGWETQVVMADDHVLCRLTITLPSGRRLSRDGIGGYSDNNREPGFRVKGGDTDALKRAAARFGVARNIKEDFEEAPGHHEPAPRRDQAGARPQGPAQGQRGGDSPVRWPPKSGKQMFVWAKQEGRVDEVNEVGKELGLPARMVEWTTEDLAEVVRAMDDGGD
jgi:hypothetical protein